MAKPQMEPAKMEVNRTDIQIMLAIGICVLTANLLNRFGLKFPYGEMRLEIIQKMTAAIACLLCVQGDVTASRKAGWIRIKVTLMGGLAGVVVAVVDTWIGNEWFNIILIMAGLLLALLLCKAAKVPYMNCRIGGITFVLVACTLQENARIFYAVFRLLSTIYGVLAVMLVTWLFGIFTKKQEG